MCSFWEHTKLKSIYFYFSTFIQHKHKHGLLVIVPLHKMEDDICSRASGYGESLAQPIHQSLHGLELKVEIVHKVAFFFITIISECYSITTWSVESSKVLCDKNWVTTVYETLTTDSFTSQSHTEKSVHAPVILTSLPHGAEGRPHRAAGGYCTLCQGHWFQVPAFFFFSIFRL